MSDQHDDLARLREIIARYLDGALPFEEAAIQLAAIMGAGTSKEPAVQEPPKRRKIDLQPLSVEQWLNPPEPSGPSMVLAPVKLAPGRAEKDEARARLMWIAAMKRVVGSRK